MIGVFNELVVVKRSGQRVSFNSLKIAVAIKSAFDSIGHYKEKDINKVYSATLQCIEKNYVGRKTINVEDIQDIIENILKQDKYFDVYKHFKEYRTRRAESRKAFSIKQQHKFVKAMENIGLDKSEYGNPSQGLYNFGTTIANEYTKSYVIDNKYVRSYEEGKIFIHNFSFFNLGYLSSIHLKIDKFLKEQCFYEFLCLLLNVQKEVRGEVCIDSADKLLSKYLQTKFKIIFRDNLYHYLKMTGYLEFINFKRVEELIDKENSEKVDLDIYNEIFVSESSQSILKNAYVDSLNTIKELMRSNVYKLLKSLSKQSAETKYSFSLGNYNQEFGRFIQECFLDVIEELDNLNNIVVIYKLNKKSDIEIIDRLSLLIEKGKNLKLSFIDSTLNKNSDEDIEYFSNGLRIFENINNNKLSTGRMNVSCTSIDIARLGLKYRTLNYEFYNELDDLLELVKNQLIFVFETIGDKNKSNYQILFTGNVLDDEKLDGNQKIRKVIKNGTLNINLIGLRECAIIIDNDNQDDVIIKLLKYISDKVNNYSLENKLNFTLSAINYCDASKELIDLDKTVFGIIDKVTKKEYYEELNNGGLNELNMSFVSKCQKLLNGGNILEIIIPRKVSCKKISEIIHHLLSSDISFASIRSDRCDN